MIMINNNNDNNNNDNNNDNNDNNNIILGSLATASEDGQIKTWSKNGNLRSTLVQSESVIYCLSWGPDSESLCYCSDSNIFIKSL
jgi:WD40 repeat protein